MNEKRSFDDKLMEAARTLETAVTPERDLWPNIENAIAKPSRGRWNTVFAQAAAVVLLVGASSGLTYVIMNNRIPPATPHINTAPLQIDQASFGDSYVLGPDYQDARDGLRAQFEEQLERLTPEERAEIMRNVDAIRSVIEEINRALSNDPHSALLQELLLSTYQEELSIMMKVDGVTKAVMFRNDF